MGPGNFQEQKHEFWKLHCWCLKCLSLLQCNMSCLSFFIFITHTHTHTHTLTHKMVCTNNNYVLYISISNSTLHFLAIIPPHLKLLSHRENKRTDRQRLLPIQLKHDYCSFTVRNWKLHQRPYHSLKLKTIYSKHNRSISTFLHSNITDKQILSSHLSSDLFSIIYSNSNIIFIRSKRIWEIK